MIIYDECMALIIQLLTTFELLDEVHVVSDTPAALEVLLRMGSPHQPCANVTEGGRFHGKLVGRA